MALCDDLSSVFGIPNSEPLGACQWDMALINANEATYATATGAGVKVGVIDSGIDLTHPDVAPNLDVELSCSFIYDDTPTGARLPYEAGHFALLSPPKHGSYASRPISVTMLLSDQQAPV